MLALVSALDAAWYSPRTYVVAATDALGHAKAAQAEAALAAARGRRRLSPPALPTVLTIPRSREVAQSSLPSVWPPLVPLAACVRLVWTSRPDLLLVNGPGTCLPLVAAAVAARWARRSPTRVAYVESIARTEALSLTGRLLYWLRLADLFFVQWEGLAAKLPRAVYAGRLF